MSKQKPTVAEQRKYALGDGAAAKSVATVWLKQAKLDHVTEFGLPEIDDRYHVWRVPILNALSKERIGEVVIDARTSLIQERKSTSPAALEARLLGREEPRTVSTATPQYPLSDLRNTIAMSDCEHVFP